MGQESLKISMSRRDCRTGETVDERWYWWGRESLRIPMSRRDCRIGGTMDTRLYLQNNEFLKIQCPTGLVPGTLSLYEGLWK